jgi:hypothetical protein
MNLKMDKNNNVSISFFILTYKRPKELLECIRSILKSIREANLKKYKIFISDQSNGESSTADLIALTKNNSYLKYKIEKDIGIQNSWINFYKSFDYDYGWVLSDDDVLEPLAIKCALNTINNDFMPDICILNYSHYSKDVKILKKSGVLGKQNLKNLSKGKLLERFHIHIGLPSNIVIRKDVFKKDILPSKKMFTTEFAHLFIIYASLTKNAKISFNKISCVRYRTGNAAVNYNWDEVFVEGVPFLLDKLLEFGYTYKNYIVALTKFYFRYIIIDYLIKIKENNFSYKRIFYISKHNIINSYFFIFIFILIALLLVFLI